MNCTLSVNTSACLSRRRVSTGVFTNRTICIEQKTEHVISKARSEPCIGILFFAKILLLPNPDIAAGCGDTTFIFGIICTMWNIDITTLCICGEAIASVRIQLQVNIAAHSRYVDCFGIRNVHIHIATCCIAGQAGICGKFAGRYITACCVKLGLAGSGTVQQDITT